MNGERVTHRSEWFTLQDAALQLLPLQEDMPFATASQISPSGMTLAGKDPAKAVAEFQQYLTLSPTGKMTRLITYREPS